LWQLPVSPVRQTGRSFWISARLTTSGKSFTARWPAIFGNYPA
jgi:hypothetical protein